MNAVQPGSFLTLHYRLAGPDGADIINTFADKPATLSLGGGQLAQALEARLLGLQEGTRTSFELAAGEAFGDRNPELLQRVNRSLLIELGDPDARYVAGDVVQFPTPDGSSAYAGVVREVGADWLLFDFNHPLAGQPVRFEVQLIGGAVMENQTVNADPHVEDVLLAEPRGFCAGVDRAIEIVERALKKFGAPIYVRHEIVHNTYVVNDLKTRGAIFIEDLAEVPAGAVLVFSAHGVSQAIRREAADRGFGVFDATCPLVTKVHVEMAKLRKEGYDFIMIGHKGHPEVEGTMGQLADGIYLVEDVADVSRISPAQVDRLAVVTQTTLSVDDAAEILAAVKHRFPTVRQPKQQDICYATQNRQDAVKVLAPKVDVVIVVGSPTSSNSNRLRELAERLGTDAHMVDSAADLRAEWFDGKQRVGLTAGASAPEVLVQQVIERLRALGAVSVRSMPGVVETIEFPLPMGLGDKSMQAVQHG